MAALNNNNNVSSNNLGGQTPPSPLKITLINYNDKRLEEKEIKSPDECKSYRNSSTVTWVNIEGIHRPDIVNEFNSYFQLHPLVKEDILTRDQRPKVVDYENYIYIVVKMLYFNDIKGRVEVEQMSIVLGDNYVFTFQEKNEDAFSRVRELLHKEGNRIRLNKSDFLVYSLFDRIVDNYFIILEKIGEQIEVLEKKLVSNLTPKTLTKINSLKNEMIYLRRSVWPLRDVIRTLEREESKLIQKSTWPYFRDVYDHTIQVIETMETYRDVLSNMMDLYISSTNNRLNEVMKVLTIISTIFIPLTFITGIYGMNFDFMPELKIKYAYPILLSVMLFIGLGMIAYFRRRRWW